MKQLFKIIVGILIPLTLALNCKRHEDFTNSKLTKAHVIEVKKKHWGKGFYKLTVLYEYQIGNENYEGEFVPEGKVRNYSLIWIAGDSILIKYNIDKLNESKFVKRTYSKPRIN